MNLSVPDRDVEKLCRALEMTLDHTDKLWLGAGYRRVLNDLYRQLLRAQRINPTVSTKE